MRNFVGLFATIVLLAACTTADVHRGPSRPAVVPAGWVADYDYESGIQRYLRQQYDSARLEGATAYVYLYSDAGTRCRTIRRSMKRERIAPLLRDVRVSMLDYWRLKDLYKTSQGVAFDPGDASGTFVKISMDGLLTDVMFHAGVFLYRPDLLYEYGYSEPRKPTFEEFAEELKRFFTRNAEI